MRSDLSDITVVMDRSGSMNLCKAEAEDGLNSFIEQQKKDSLSSLFTLVQFDTEYEFVHKGVDIKTVPRLTLVPRGWTALLDAVGRAIIETGERLSKMPESERPGLVVFVIVTDGHENSSKEFTKTKIKEMIQHQQEVYKWQFTFLGANQDAFAEAAGMGIPAQAASGYDVKTSGNAFASASANVMRMKHMAFRGETVECFYSAEERQAMSSPSDPAPKQ